MKRTICRIQKTVQNLSLDYWEKKHLLKDIEVLKHYINAKYIKDDEEVLF